MTTPNDETGGERPTGPESFPAPGESPPTQPEGALVPPPPKPPTAVGAEAAPLPPNPRRHSESWRQPGWRHRTPFANVVTEIFDALDTVADRIAETLRLRR